MSLHNTMIAPCLTISLRAIDILYEELPLLSLFATVQPLHVVVSKTSCPSDIFFIHQATQGCILDSQAPSTREKHGGQSYVILLPGNAVPF